MAFDSGEARLDVVYLVVCALPGRADEHADLIDLLGERRFGFCNRHGVTLVLLANSLFRGLQCRIDSHLIIARDLFGSRIALRKLCRDAGEFL